ncbi:MAG TPA: TonB-dependent receptor, partial [Bryobacteraceae bacterium]
MTRASSAVCISFLCIATAAGVRAQSVDATLKGRVTDASDAAVPGIKVEARNTGTNVASNTVTDTAGQYTIPLLKPGAYSLTVEAPGFKKFTREGLSLSVGDTVEVDIKLQVGAVTEQLTVTAETSLLETAKADRGTLVDERTVAEMPLNGRNPFMLAKIAAGVNFNGTVIYQRPFDNGAIAQWTINGGLYTSNEFLLDGTPNNAQAGSNNLAYVPPVDAVQEFKIQTNSYDAQYGHTSGGIVNVSLKSGTNSPHGTVYEFARRKAWDANSFQNNAVGAPKGEHYLDQYGGQIGGPVYIPKIYDGRNRTFFMFDYEKYRENTPRPFTLSVPAPEFSNGDFSKLVNGAGQKVTIFDPFTGQNVNGTWVRQLFSGNMIPPEFINPIAKKIISYFPAPNTTSPGQGYSQGNQYFDAPDKDSFYNEVLKFDQQLGAKHRISFRENRNNRLEMGWDGSNSITGVGQAGSLPEIRTNDGLALEWVGVLSPQLVVNARVSFSRYLGEDRGDANAGVSPTTLGFPASLANALPGGAFFGVYNFSNYFSLGQYPTGNITNTGALATSVNWNVRGHAIKFGADLRDIQYVTQNFSTALSLSADSGWTQQNYAQSDPLSGNSIASFLLGTPSSGSSGYNLLGVYKYAYYAPWIQDDWRITPRLTLNLGLRWDFNLPPVERYNRMDRGFDATATSPLDKSIDRTQYPGFPTVTGGLLFAGVNGQPRSAADTYMKAIQPRAGFAYRVTNRLVARGGWGRYYLNPSNNYIQSTGFSTSTPLVASLDSGRTPIRNLINNPFPSGLLLPPGPSAGLLTNVGQSLTVVNHGFLLPHMDQFSFGFQYELPGNSRLEISYVGSRGTNLESSRSINPIPLSLRQQCDFWEGGVASYCQALIPNPFYQLTPFNGTSYFSSPTLARSTLGTPYPQFTGVTLNNTNLNASWYNSMQLGYEVRTHKGLTLVANWTLAKQVYQNGYNDVQKQVLERSIYQYDQTHNVKFSAVYELPFGPGKRFLTSSSRLVSRLVGGWETNVLFFYHSGIPWRLLSNFIYIKEAKLPNIDWNAPLVQVVQPCVAQWNTNGTITMQSFSTKAGCTDYNFLSLPLFAPAAEPQYSGQIRTMSAPNTDASLNKTTRIRERASVQFRAEVFNVSNKFNFYQAQPNSTLTSSAFGTVN